MPRKLARRAPCSGQDPRSGPEIRGPEQHGIGELVNAVVLMKKESRD